MTLRTQLIKLAHENPDLREDLLPILKQGGLMDRRPTDFWFVKLKVHHRDNPARWDWDRLLDVSEKDGESVEVFDVKKLRGGERQAAIRSLVKFELPRRVVMTRGVSETAKRNRKFSSEVRKALFDYQHGKWGKTQRDSVKRNNAVLNDGAEDQVFAVYETDEGDIYIITEWDKSATTILFAHEY